ncbi:MAG: response regulator [Pirellulaceae bacterium]
MPKRVLDIGNCLPDHRAIVTMIESNFDARVSQADRWDDAVEQLRSQPFDLVLVSRKLDIDYSDGLEVIRRIKQDPQLKSLPVMMVTNFGEHQQQAVQAGAVEGFGKQSLRAPGTLQKLAPFLNPSEPD